MPPSPEQMPVPASSAPVREGDLGLLGQRAEAHVGDEERDLERAAASSRVGPDDQLGADRRVVEQRQAVRAAR